MYILHVYVCARVLKALHTLLSLISCIMRGFDEVRAHRTPSKCMILERGRCVELCHRESKVCRALSNKFGVVQAHRTSSNPLKTYIYKTESVHVCTLYITRVFTLCSICMCESSVCMCIICIPVKTVLFSAVPPLQSVPL